MHNKTYFSFRQPSDWQNGFLNNLEIEQQGLRLKREQRYRHSKRIPFEFTSEQSKWLDAHDCAEGWFWLNDQNQIYRYEKQLRQRELILKLKLDKNEQAYRLAIHNEQVFVLTIDENEDANRSQLYCFYINNGQLRWKIDQWKQNDFGGYSLIVTAQETVVVVARLNEQSTSSFLQFDSLGYPMHETDIPQLTLSSVLLEEANRWNQTYRLVKADDNVYLFDLHANVLMTYNSVTSNIMRVTLSQITEPSYCFTVDSKGLLWFTQSLREQQLTELICFNPNGEIEQQGTLLIEHSDYMIISQKLIIVFDLLQTVAYMLEPNQLPLYSESLQGYRGLWISQPLDSEMVGTIWHRFVMSIKKQHDTTVNVKYYASDTRQVDVQQMNSLWTHHIEDPEDALFINAVGRYIWIGIEVIGTDIHTPCIESLELHFPRQSYIKDLPVIYQRSEQGFLTNFLSLFQTMIEDTNFSIEGATRKLEPQQVSGQSLKWLLGWMGLDTDDYWTEEQLRTLLQEAPNLFRLRGTKYAIERLVEIYTGSKPILLEYDDIKSLKENAELGEVIDKLYAADEHTFNVLVKADDVGSELKKITLQHILDRYKPVFTTCKLVILQPWVYMDLHSYLGMNTFLTAPQQLLLNGQMSMPHHTITLDVGHHNQLDKHSRIGLNSKLE